MSHESSLTPVSAKRGERPSPVESGQDSVHSAHEEPETGIAIRKRVRAGIFRRCEERALDARKDPSKRRAGSGRSRSSGRPHVRLCYGATTTAHEGDGGIRCRIVAQRGAGSVMVET
jgi:hypothetical protein